MAILKKKSKKDEIVQARRQRRSSTEPDAPMPFWSSHYALPTLLFLGYTALIIIVCFFGQSPAGPQILPDQTPKFRVVADFPFTFESKIERERLIEERRQRVAPIYRLDMGPFEEFKKNIIELNEGMSHLKSQAKSSSEANATVERFTDNFNAKHRMNINAEDVHTLLDLKTTSRTQLIDESLIYEEDLYRAGISPSSRFPRSNNMPSFISIEIKGRDTHARIQSEEEALVSLRRYLRAMDVSSRVSTALFRVVKGGIHNNLIYDASRTEKKVNEAVTRVDAVIVRVNEGETIIEPGTPVTFEQHERLTAYRKALRSHQEYDVGFSSMLLERIVLTLGIILGALIYVRLGVSSLRGSKRNWILCASMLLVNLIFIRLILQLGDGYLVPQNSMLAALLPYMIPSILAPMCVMIILGGAPAILTAFLVSIFTTLMLGRSIEMFTFYLVTSLIAIYFCRNVKKRSQIMRASFFAGFAGALGAIFIGIFDQLDTLTLSQQALVAELAGLLTGIAVIGLIPILESVFKYTTDISLRELTDFNHRLLRQLQMVAPGTYHHSLMVANIAERAAREIGANPLICRACALFHDVGKSSKPEYFTENQRENVNPHIEKNPSMSVLVIKNHVSEGLEIAKEAKLPKIILDVIQQHHGTSLIQYFYSKAKTLQSENQLPLGDEFEEEDVDESMFRYDGPRPQFKESAIIMLADGCEAASRSLQKVSPQSVEELVDSIIHERIEDGQFNECPLTMKELSQIKRSLIASLLNIHHSRISYPNKKNGKGKE